MRLTSGAHGGRRLKTPAAGLRPTQDKVRAAIFSSLAALVPGARVLDLFAGTGALGLEAWSRGAARIKWVENHHGALRVLHENLHDLGVPPDAGEVRAADVFRLLARPGPGTAFDLVLADPPYAEAKTGRWQEKLAGLLAQNGWVRSGGVFVFETEGKDPPPDLPGWRLARDRSYGATRVLIWVRKPAAPA